MNKLILTVEDAIYYCIEIGTPDGKSLLETFKRRGRLDNKNSFNSLIKNLETKYHSVSFLKKENGEIQTGKDRRVIIENEKIKMTKKESKNIGSRANLKENEKIKSYIFQRLLNMILEGSTRENTISQWVNELEIFDLDSFNWEEVEDLFTKYYSEKETYKVARSIYSRLDERVRESVKLAFKQLEKEKKISKRTRYYKNVQDNSVEVSKNEFEKIKISIEEVTMKFGLQYSNYVAMRMSHHTYPNKETIIELVDEMLEEKYEIAYIYETIDIKILNKLCEYNVSKEEMDQAFLQKLVSLTNNNQKKREKDKKVENFVESEFKSFNMYYFLYNILSVEGFEEELIRLKPSQEAITNTRIRRINYAIAKAEKERIKNAAF